VDATACLVATPLPAEDGDETRTENVDDDEFDAIGPANPDTISEEDRAPWL